MPEKFFGTWSRGRVIYLCVGIVCCLAGIAFMVFS